MISSKSAVRGAEFYRLFKNFFFLEMAESGCFAFNVAEESAS